MKNLIFSLFLVGFMHPANSNAEDVIENLECLEASANYLGVLPNDGETVLLGKLKSDGRKCQLTMKYFKGTTGLSNGEDAYELRIWVDEESPYTPGGMMKGNWAELVYNHGLLAQTTKQCDVGESALELDFVSHQTSGWRKSTGFQITVNKNAAGKISSVTSREGESGFWYPEYNCIID